MLEAERVGVSLGGSRILDDVTLSAPAGEVLALCGPNGAGKSTLLALLAGERAPDRGVVRLGGAPIGVFSPMDLARRRAVLEQHPATMIDFTVGELAALGAAPARPETEFDDEAAIALALERAGVAHLRDRVTRSLSGGERHRAHFARALVQLAAGRAEGGGGVLLLDEPTASLDLAHQASVMRAARRIAGEGAAVIAVLHDLTLAAAFADRIALLAKGRLETMGAPRDALTEERLTALYGVEISVGYDAQGRPRIQPVFSADDPADAALETEDGAPAPGDAFAERRAS
ncbi:MAG: heme ABC transporter ATP-binding protein [Pseudomonadota bacterium]